MLLFESAQGVPTHVSNVTQEDFTSTPAEPKRRKGRKKMLVLSYSDRYLDGIKGGINISPCGLQRAGRKPAHWPGTIVRIAYLLSEHQ
jgi:hypothetical protein